MKVLNPKECQAISGGFYINIGFGEPTPAIDPNVIIAMLSFAFASGAYAHSKIMSNSNSIQKPVYETKEDSN
jgi:hypothetical protein